MVARNESSSPLSSCASRAISSAALGAAMGGAMGSVFGTLESLRQGIPGAYKLRFIGQYTLISTGAFGAVLCVASFGHCLRRMG